jgi:archaellum component FlaG (FlaF/FlaG flagellin family)
VLRSLSLSLFLLVVPISNVWGQQWASKMFKIAQHDFGSVAAGAKSEFAFEFQNIYEEDLHVASVRTSCGCTSPRVTKDNLKTWEKSQVIAKFNTHSFRGQRSATITVVFDKPYYAEVQLTVSGYIRSDITFEPGEIDFGEVDQSQSAERKVSVNYAGRSDWKIVDVRSAGKNFEVELNETSRQGGRVSYDMLVRLKPSAPAGYFQDQLTLVTDDQQSKSIPVMVHGSVVAPVSVSPASLFLGVLEPGQKVTKNLIVKGKKPFKVECIDCDENEKLEFKLPSEATKNVYVIPVTFTAGDSPGEFSQKITIKTSLGDSVDCCCLATAKVRESKSPAAK